MGPGHERQTASLAQQVADLEGRLGEVAGELVELTFQLAPFLARYRREVLTAHEELVELQRRIADLRLARGDRAAQSAARANTPLSRLVEVESYPSVQAQFERTWASKQPLRAGDILENTALPPSSAAIKALYAEIVARLHPDLTLNEDERERRRELIRGVNRAYLNRDQVSLEAVADAHRPRHNLPAVVDEQAVEDLRQRAFLLEQTIARLEGKVYELRHGDAARVMAFAAAAQAEGHDLLSELNQAIQREIEEARQQLTEEQS